MGAWLSVSDKDEANRRHNNESPWTDQDRLATIPPGSEASWPVPDWMPPMETQPYSAEEARTMDFLKLDYEAARVVVDKLDGQLFAVRNWAVTTTDAIAALIVGRTPPRNLGRPGANRALAFLELMYKGYHDEAIGRSKYVETRIHRLL
jgi:hypothetical protein